MNSPPGDSATMLKMKKPKYFVNASLNAQGGLGVLRCGIAYVSL